MKKTVLLTMLLSIATFSHCFALKMGPDRITSQESGVGSLLPIAIGTGVSSKAPISIGVAVRSRGIVREITSMVINAHVTVVLVNASSQPIRIGGNNFFLLNVEFKQTGGKLVIESAKKRDMKNKGTIYIPAASLKYIEINSDAAVRSATSLEIPQLDILVNGDCRVSIKNLGKVNIKEGPGHEVKYALFTSPKLVAREP